MERRVQVTHFTMHSTTGRIQSHSIKPNPRPNAAIRQIPPNRIAVSMGGKLNIPPKNAHASATSAANTGTFVANAPTNGSRRRRKSQSPPRDNNTTKSYTRTDKAKLPHGIATSLETTILLPQ